MRGSCRADASIGASSSVNRWAAGRCDRTSGGGEQRQTIDEEGHLPFDVLGPFVGTGPTPCPRTGRTPHRRPSPPAPRLRSLGAPDTVTILRGIDPWRLRER
ncbi:MAG: hypothetical protein AVDCRST_MAG87-2528 [uncultured Thermomicrobiales bacterium]|uniref:Uncharacterized protein n=1 Tax=uncultured Thermomicrobiales bacterium TaxID=1645740 RepID=A0A6J4VB39_9BACT|nr:MAG: hypothetical protein AVDCRST_MAG87-2528 [uncultured Thermomicrobiales bacterium]